MARIRSTANALRQLFFESRHPIYALDAERRIIFCNSACANWVGREENELIGQQCGYHSADLSSEHQTQVNGLCPTPESFSGQQGSGDIFRITSLGQVERIRADFFPLANVNGEIAGVLTLVGPKPTSENNLATELTPAGLHRQLRSLRNDLGSQYRLSELIGESPAVQRVRRQVQLASRSSACTVITGPQGSGREHIARTIHYGEDAQQAPPLLPIACELFDPELLQVTITSFVRQFHKSTDHSAATLLLLNVDRLRHNSQEELLGLMSLPRFAMRTIATSLRPLKELVENNEFSAHLAFTLSTLVVEMPALKDRPEDIPLLTQFFLEKYNALQTRQLSGFSAEALDRLVEHPETFGIDELRMLVEEACQSAEGPFVETNDLPPRLQWTAEAVAQAAPIVETCELDQFLTDVEREVIQRMLDRAKGNRAKTARSLGISRARLLRRIEALGIE
ncbi:MAG: sigma 54-interacting transcriptional regulator [Pirellulaceae bacterium]|nr:sigma 54-interacting transcriptional regulator [Pirellulaceae bacterium]